MSWSLIRSFQALLLKASGDLFFHYSLRELTLSGPFTLKRNCPLAVFSLTINHEAKFAGIRRLKIWRHISSLHVFQYQDLMVFFKEIFTEYIIKWWEPQTKNADELRFIQVSSPKKYKLILPFLTLCVGCKHFFHFVLGITSEIYQFKCFCFCLDCSSKCGYIIVLHLQELPTNLIKNVLLDTNKLLVRN